MRRGLSLVLDDLAGLYRDVLAPPVLRAGVLDVEAGDPGVPAVHIVREREHAVIAGRKVGGVASPLGPLLARGASAGQESDHDERRSRDDLGTHSRNLL